jgi:muconolactone delta-isomerase
MAVYMVERDLKGITMPQLAGAQQAAIAASQRFTADGTPVRYIRSTFVPGESRCMCLFDAQSAADVQQVNEAAKLPFTRIVEALDLTPAS